MKQYKIKEKHIIKLNKFIKKLEDKNKDKNVTNNKCRNSTK